MAVRSRRGSRTEALSRPPARPRPPTQLDQATCGDLTLEDEAVYRRLALFDLDLSAGAAEAVEFEQCRFRGTSLSGTTLIEAVFGDCLFENSDLANLRAERSSLSRVELSELRMTGMHWVDGSLRDVTVTGCRADLASFRFSVLRNVTFHHCNLVQADFQNSDVSGIRFIDCDLSAAQFSQATMRETRLSNCVLAGLGGVRSLSGAIVSSADLTALTHTFAQALGIQIQDVDDEVTSSHRQR